MSYAYIGFVVVFGNFFLLQLFLAILIDNFTEASEEALEAEQEAKEEEAARLEEERRLKQQESNPKDGEE